MLFAFWEEVCGVGQGDGETILWSEGGTGPIGLCPTNNLRLAIITAEA